MAKYLPVRAMTGGVARGETASAGAADDEALVTRVRLGDASAFEMLYRKYYAALFRFATATTRSSASAEEVVQDVFLGIWRRREEWQVDHGVAVYLYGAVRNRALNLERHAISVQRFQAQVVRDAAVFPGLQVARETPEAALDAAELAAVVRRALTKLPEREQTALRLRWVEELTYAQLGRVFGITEEGARLLLHRAERAVRSLVRDSAV